MTDHPHSSGHGRSGGFTLIELMIALVVAAILVGIAVPSYTAQVQKSRRTEARYALLDIAAREERFLSVTNAYSALPSDVGYTAAGAWPVVVGGGYYSVNVQVPDPAAPAGIPSYIVTATAIGTQVNDTACATYTVNTIGQQTALDSGAVANTATCWGN